MSHIFSVLVAGAALLPHILVCSRADLVIYGIVACSVSALGFISRRADFWLLAICWGLVLPIAPFLGAELAETLGLSVLFLVVGLSPQTRWFAWAIPILLYLSGAAVYETAASVFGKDAYASLVRRDELSRIHDALRGFFAVQAPSWRYLSHVILLVGCVDIFSSLSGFRAYWRRGFLCGATLSALYAIAQWCGLLPWTLSNQTPFWTSIGRTSGLMTDPNALGVVMALALWVLLYCDRPPRIGLKGLLALGVIFAAAGIVSGSRTFWLGGVVAVVGITYIRAPQLLWRMVAAGVALIVVVTLLDGVTPLITMTQTSEALPQGIRRIISAMSLSRLEDTIASRRVFFALARTITERDPLFGVGPNAFAAYVPLVGASIPSLKGWTDNSNNFYLGILAELGILGLCAFLMTITARRMRAGDDSQRNGVAILAVGVMLLTGPHTDFVEVMIPLAFLIGVGTTPRRVQSYFAAYVSGLFCVSGVISARHHERGVYEWHADGNSIRRWLSPVSTIQVRCSDEQGVRERALLIKPSYVPAREPLRVAIKSEVYARELELSDTSEVSISLPCGVYSVSVKPAWSPARAWPQDSTDRRLLGVEQIERLQ